ncbi:hypothetical protein [Fortiea sp. LEGE XX443]|uniref:hypothetical protein n=1 Tax=Fortiea sp. LEGE XX443 TaxID=1828611 RepID=UPI001D14CA3C|nr:hypothetical protein [Fortiea sp. LEGE XX443]
MEHWQFLIQKQGDRSWHTLESPNIQILEGWYRVLARSNLPNTDVEVRVTHSSTQEVPPKRRIQKRSRRTNSEGLMAVIPFTLLKPGIWELRCSGDLMSDIFGKSWQYSVYLQVLSQLADGDIEKLTGGGNLESNSLDFFMISLPHSQNSPQLDSISGNQFGSNTAQDVLIPTESEINTHSDSTSEISSKIASIASDRIISISTEETTDNEGEQPVEETLITGDRTILVPTEEITDAEVEPPVEETLITGDRTFSVPTEGITDNEVELYVEETLLTGDRIISVPTEEITDAEVEPPVEETLLTGDRTFSVSTEEITDGDSVSSDLSIEQEEEAIIDQLVSPVWLKGETAEQILQNLIDQALPTSELLLEDEQLEEFPTTQPAPPLLLTLEQENYIARWGQGLSINANVELQANTHLKDEPQYSTTLHALEIKIEIRSPLSSEILTQVRQPLTDNLLPFTINSAINIPVDCESKLLLGELSLYGALTDFGEVILLASRSFTITADVTELLAMTVVAKTNQQNFLEDSSALAVSVPNTEPEASVSLGLELFNLVKTPLTQPQPQTILPSPNQPLPPQINLLSFNKSGDLRSPQLPKLPENQVSAIAVNDVVTESPSEGKEELEQKDNVPVPTTIPLAPINLEQLEIKNRRGWMLGNIFPYLKRLTTLPADKTEEKTNPQDVSDTSTVQDSLQVEPAITADDNLDADDPTVETLDSLNSELLAESMTEMAITPSLEFSNNSILEPATPFSSELIAEVNPYSSPLIRKWMQSQGYFVPELPPATYQSDKNEVIEPQIAPVEEEPSLPMPSVDFDLSSNLDMELENLDGESEMEIDTERSLIPSELWEDTEISLITEEPEELNTSAEIETENITQELSTPSLPLTQLLLTQKIKIPRAWLAQEIVVDDTYSEPEDDAMGSFCVEQKQQSISAVSNLLPSDGEMLESLPIPQMHIPEGELIAGQTIRVRIGLPEVSPQVVVKLWIEDCQTRGLLDGPHLLKDMLPKPLGGVEVMTQVNVPFGCVEIRLEAIALNTYTQQESHKATAVRTVIPPDLPNFQLDELLGL